MTSAIPPLKDSTVAPAAIQKRAQLLQLACLILWTIAIAIIAIRVGLHPEKNTVFTCYYETGVAWRHGQTVYENLRFFRYSPLVAAAFALLSFLPAIIAQYIWMALNLLTLFTGLHLWLKTAPPRSLQLDERWAVILLATPLMIGNFNNLQANPMLLGLLLFGLAFARQKRFTLATLALAAAAFLKVYPLALGLILILIYPKQLSWRLLLALIAGALLPFVVLQSPHFVADTYHQWITVNSTEARATYSLERQYQDATIFWARRVGPVSLHALRIWQLSTALLIALIALWSKWWRIAEPSRLTFLGALVIAWMLLAGPSTESSTYILAVPIIAWLLIDSLTEKRRPLITQTALSYALLLLAAASSWFPFGATFKSFGWQPLAVLLLVPTLYVWLRYRDQSSIIPDNPLTR